MDPCTLGNILVFISNAIIFDKVVPWAAQGYDRLLPQGGGQIINFIQMYTGIWQKLGKNLISKTNLGFFPTASKLTFVTKINVGLWMTTF